MEEKVKKNAVKQQDETEKRIRNIADSLCLTAFCRPAKFIDDNILTRKWWFVDNLFDDGLLVSGNEGLEDKDALDFLNELDKQRSLEYENVSGVQGIRYSFFLSDYLPEGLKLTHEDFGDLYDCVYAADPHGHDLFQDFYFEVFLPHVVQQWLEKKAR